MATSYLLKNSHLCKGVKRFGKKVKEEKESVVQQSDYLKPFMLTIVNEGLAKAYSEYEDKPPGPSPPTLVLASIGPALETEVDYDVIIIGAGMAGISAAHELISAGLTVKILEQTERYGGRVFTYSEADGLAPGLYGEAGAMRLPGDVNKPNDRAHFLTDAYISKFKLPIKKFPNYGENGLSNIYGLKEKSNEWAEKHFLSVWPHWKDGIAEDMKEKITNIDEYYDKTTAVVTDHLIQRLKNTTSVDQEIEEWDNWIDIWSQFTLESFLESNIDVIKAKIPAKDQEDLDVTTLGKLLPWSNDAVRGFSVSSYTEQLDQSLDQYLRDQLGKWWSPNMHTLKGGMHSLPEAFFNSESSPLCLEHVAFKRHVSKIAYKSCPSSPLLDHVEVSCYPIQSETEPCIFKGRAVIITVPVNVMRQITFVPLLDDEQTKVTLRKNIQAIEDIYTGPATKVILQTKSRFWEKDSYNIHGGFSKTSLPIGQIHYVTPEKESTQQGILLIYTWKNEALIFGSLTPDQVKQEVVEEIAEIHPEIAEGQVEKCIVHAWYNQPSYQGAYGLMKTTQFNNIRRLWEAMGNVHFSGENLSFAPGWIQGALESGLKSAYQVYVRHEQRKKALQTKA